MAQSDIGGLTEKEQRELLQLLEDEQENTLVLIHNVPRPHRQGQAPPIMTVDGHYILTIRTCERWSLRSNRVRSKTP